MFLMISVLGFKEGMQCVSQFQVRLRANAKERRKRKKRAYVGVTVCFIS